MTALIIGALGFINTWDWLAFMLLLLVAIKARRLREEGLGQGLFNKQTTLDIVIPAAAIAVLSLALFSPFYLTMSSGVQGVLPVHASGTELSHYVRIWGPMALAILPPAAFAVYPSEAQGHIESVFGRRHFAGRSPASSSGPSP